MSSRSRPESLFLRCFVDLLLRAYPPAFRHRHGEQIALFLAEEGREARNRGRLGAFRFGLSAAFDLICGALRARRLERDERIDHALRTSAPPPLRRHPMDSLLQDLRHAGRALRKRPGWTVAAATTLAIGIGASSAIFSLVRGVLLAPLPYPDSHRLLTVRAYVPDLGRTRGSVSYPVYEAIRHAEDATSGLGCYSMLPATVDWGGGAERMLGGVLSAAALRALGVRPATGRLFDQSDDGVDAPRTVLLSHGLWQERFGGEASAIGRSIRIGEQPTEIIGVMPAGFVFPDQDIRYWVSMAGKPRQPGRHYLLMIGRLRPGVEVETAAARLADVRLNVPTGAPGRFGNISLRAQSFLESLVGQVRPQLLLFMLAVTGVLAISCINVANLMLGRAAARGQELRVRAALGAGRFRLMRQVLAETFLLSLLGGLLGLAVAVAVEHGLLTLATSELPRGGSPGIDLRVFLFAFALSLVVGILVGLLPALRASRPATGGGLGADGRGMLGGRRRHRLHGAMAVAQIALATALLANAGLLIVNLERLSSIDTGLDTEGVLTFRPALGSAYDSIEKRRGFYRAIEQRLRALPGVTEVGFTATAPFGGGHIGEAVGVHGAPRPASRDDEIVADIQIVEHRYFDVVGLRATVGRRFEANDEIGTGRVAVVNAHFARRFFGDQHTALGRRIDVGEDDYLRTLEIVGVVPDTRPYSLVRPIKPMVFEVLAEDQEEWSRSLSLAVRVENVDPATVAAAIPDLVRAVDPGVPVSGLSAMDQRIGRQLVLPRLRMRVLTVFAVSALALALIGVYGVMTFFALDRTREIGLRLALGARRGQILRWLGSRGAVMTAAGLMLGGLAFRASAGLLEGHLFELEILDVRVIAATGTVLAAAALVAVYLPARRASRLDPVEALRSE